LGSSFATSGKLLDLKLSMQSPLYEELLDVSGVAGIKREGPQPVCLQTVLCKRSWLRARLADFKHYQKMYEMTMVC
jgi:hypothetical protein